VSGKVTFPGKLVASNVEVYLSTVLYRFSGAPYFTRLHRTFTNASGYYGFILPPSSATVTCLVSFDYNGGSGQKNVTSLSLMSDTNLNIEIPLGLWNGTVVGSDGAPVGGAYIKGYSQGARYGTSDTNGNKNEISGYTSDSGKFSIGVMTELTVNPYVDLEVRPPSDSPWLPKDIDSLMIDTTRSTIIGSSPNNPSSLPTQIPTLVPTPIPSALPKSKFSLISPTQIFFPYLIPLLHCQCTSL
jgi:hypothetical protein